MLHSTCLLALNCIVLYLSILYYHIIYVQNYTVMKPNQEGYDVVYNLTTTTTTKG